MFKYQVAPPEPARLTKLSLVVPAVLVRWVEGARLLRKLGYNIVPFETGRTLERQVWLYGQGRDWPGDLVTRAANIGKSWHGARFALDSAFVNSSGSVVWQVPQEAWNAYGKVMKSVGLAWGGDWKRPDSPHVQAVNIPTSPEAEDEKAIDDGELYSLGIKYDLFTVSYYDVGGRI